MQLDTHEALCMEYHVCTSNAKYYSSPCMLICYDVMVGGGGGGGGGKVLKKIQARSLYFCTRKHITGYGKLQVLPSLRRPKQAEAAVCGLYY